MAMHDRARDPEHRRTFEKLLYLAAQRGDADPSLNGSHGESTLTVLFPGAGRR